MDLAELGVVAKQDGVKETGDALDKLAGSAANAEDKVNKFNDGADKSNTATGAMGGYVDEAAAAFARMGPLVLAAVAAVAAFASAAITLDKFVDATSEAEANQAQLEAALKSTKGASGQTIDSLNEHAAALQRLTTYEDDTISKAQSLLLTFTKVGGEIFPKATEAAADLAQRMGGDLQGATLQVGKALQDPIRGITALSRAGIQFTENQKEMIKGFVEANNIIGAQKIILQELETQFGGSAEAARENLGGAITSLQNIFGNLFEVSGPATENLRLAIEKLITSITDPAFKDFANTIGSMLFDAVNLAVKGLALLTEGISKFWAYAGPTIKELYQIFWDFGSVVLPAVGQAFSVLWSAVEPIITYFLEGWRKVYDVTKQVIDLMNSAPPVPAAPAATEAAAKPIVNAGQTVANDIAGAMTQGASKTATAITNSSEKAATTTAATTIDTAKQASEIGSAALANSFGVGATTVSKSVGAGGDAAAAAITAAGNTMAAKFEGTGRNIYDLWNNWGNSFINSFGVSIGDLLIDFQNAQTEQLEAQAELLRAQAALTREQFNRLQEGKSIDGSDSGGSSGSMGGGSDGTSTGTLSFDLDGGDGRRRRRNRGGGNSFNVGNFDNDNRDNDKGIDRNKWRPLDERGNVQLTINNKSDPQDTLDNINTSKGGRTIINVLGNNRRKARAILGIRG